jgi:putative transposase
VHRQGPVRQKGGAGEAEATGRNPTDRGKPGTKRHHLTEGKGIPTAVLITGANRHDCTKLAALLDAQVVEPAPAEPPHLAIDRGYDYDACRAEAVARGSTGHIPPKASAERPIPPPGHPDRHPPRRWVVEVTHAWFNRFRRVLIRWEKHGTTYLGFVQLAACLIIYRKVRHARSLSG